MKKFDVYILTLMITDAIRWARIEALQKQAQALLAKEQVCRKRAKKLIDEIEASPDFKKVKKKVRAHIRKIRKSAELQ